MGKLVLSKVAEDVGLVLIVLSLLGNRLAKQPPAPFRAVLNPCIVPRSDIVAAKRPCPFKHSLELYEPVAVDTGIRCKPQLIAFNKAVYNLFFENIPEIIDVVHNPEAGGDLSCVLNVA